MSKFTPGPWFVGPQGKHKIASITQCTGIFGDVAPSPGTINADARLISAAPDMYEALKAIEDMDAEQLANRDFMPMLLEALAKADGK